MPLMLTTMSPPSSNELPPMVSSMSPPRKPACSAGLPGSTTSTSRPSTSGICNSLRSSGPIKLAVEADPGTDHAPVLDQRGQDALGQIDRHGEADVLRVRAGSRC